MSTQTAYTKHITGAQTSIYVEEIHDTAHRILTKAHAVCEELETRLPAAVADQDAAFRTVAKTNVVLNSAEEWLDTVLAGLAANPQAGTPQ